MHAVHAGVEMKASELVAELQAAIAEHGDLEVEATWEGITRPYEPPCVHSYYDEPQRRILVIESDGDCYSQLPQGVVPK